jgi:hypothetical protein
MVERPIWPDPHEFNSNQNHIIRVREWCDDKYLGISDAHFRKNYKNDFPHPRHPPCSQRMTNQKKKPTDNMIQNLKRQL